MKKYTYAGEVKIPFFYEFSAESDTQADSIFSEMLRQEDLTEGEADVQFYEAKDIE